MATSFRASLCFLLLAAGALTAGCASAPPARPPAITPAEKTGWILQLEDQRVLRGTPPAPAAPPTEGKRGAVPAPPPPPDLTQLVADPDARIRRRAALAIGRVGLADGAAPLRTALADADPDVRAMAAFALGLLADKGSVAVLVPLLQDPVPLVRGRAAEALGLIGDASAAAEIGQMAAGYIRSGAIASLQPDDETWPGPPESAAVRLALFALVRLKAWDPLAAAVLDASGRPLSQWWPVAYALQRIGDPRARTALEALAQSTGRSTRAFAARGLGALKDTAAIPILTPMVDPAHLDLPVAVSAIRALGRMETAAAAEPLIALLRTDGVDPNIRLEAIDALGALKARDAEPFVQDLLADPWPTMRAAALRAAAAIDPDTFLLVLSGLEPDRHWSVRATLADVLATLPANVAVSRLRPLLQDDDKRVVPAAIRALVHLAPPDAGSIVLGLLNDPDIAVRSAAATAVGALKPAGGAAALRDAYTTALADSSYGARAAILAALVEYGAAEATPTLKSALADKDWALRVRAADLLARLDPAADGLQQIRPVPSPPITPYASPDLIDPPYSPHAFIETAKGTIEIELAVLDAPQTTHNFMALARRGFFNGLQIHRVVPDFVVQDGDPRGDGEGGPGYTIRDELNDLPYLRGTVGMALEWRDTGGSQFFITASPQPHLDAKYTAFGRVVKGMDVVDRIQQWDVIQRVRIWDGQTMQ
jgi:cyclophilin family peptidyl-prolyl cis-trans isomerase/HEAT repeat protein